MQDGIKVQAGKIPKIDKRAGWNKAVQDGKFQFLSVKIKVLPKKFPKCINVQDGISLCRMDFFQKRIRFCCTIIQETRVTLKATKRIQFFLLVHFSKGERNKISKDEECNLPKLFTITRNSV